MGQQRDLAVELSAVIVSLEKGEPKVMVAPGPALPSGPFEMQHRTLEQAMRAWVAQHNFADLGYVEQLYTFADKGRAGDKRFVSIGYLALGLPAPGGPETMDWYAFFPWEDHREGPPAALLARIRKNLACWKNAAADTPARRDRAARIAVTFPKDPRDWNEEMVLQRYELLWEAGLIEEAARAHRGGVKTPLIPGLAMTHDHRRILATGIARLRAKIKYRPVVFELLPERFTLLQLQETVEALAGLRLHKQNFRRLVLSQGLVEETRAQSRDTKGRPAKLYAFRREIVQQRAVAGTKLPRSG